MGNWSTEKLVEVHRSLWHSCKSNPSLPGPRLSPEPPDSPSFMKTTLTVFLAFFPFTSYAKTALHCFTVSLSLCICGRGKGSSIFFVQTLEETGGNLVIFTLCVIFLAQLHLINTSVKWEGEVDRMKNRNPSLFPGTYAITKCIIMGDGISYSFFST